jgi:hypothetical protein
MIKRKALTTPNRKQTRVTHSVRQLQNPTRRPPQSQKGRKKRRNYGPRSDAISYSGPIVMPASMEEAELFTMNFGFMALVTGNGSGTFAGVYETESIRNAADWSSVATSFDEYRVVGFTVEILWHRRYDTTFLWMPWIAVVDRGDLTALTSYNIGANAESASAYSPFDKIKKTIKMKSCEEAEFISVLDLPTSWGSIKFYTTGNTASATLGYAYFNALVQFRGRT